MTPEGVFLSVEKKYDMMNCNEMC
jgi:hypothetical protein